jgi:DNA polymerase (family 10)
MTMPPGVAGSYLVHFTGSAEHNVALRQRARELGWSLSEHGLSPLEGRTPRRSPRTFATEAELYGVLGLDEIPPELREGRGEVEAAAQGRLPRLVSLADLQGDCHSHSDWSDGREPLEVMIASARSAGRRYQVVTDHSWSLGVANGLSPQRVEQQRRVIAELNERFAREEAAGDLPPGAHAHGFRLLHGCELEITADGRLDYDDALLARFDVVVASLHVGRRQPREQLMARYERAMRSPHVDIISHPSGRKIGQRPDLDLDWESFYRLAAETGTLLEVNGSEERLDLEPARIRAARDAGCGFVISSDAHDRAEWQHLVLGTAMARRGWLEPRHVANTYSLEAFLRLMGDKPHRLPG